MGRKRKKVTNFYPEIIQNTSCEKLETNYLLQTVDTNKKTINYVVPHEIFHRYVLKVLEYSFISGKITHEEAREILYKDIFSIYKTKISVVRISLLILNFLVKEEILYSDDNEEYKLIKCQDEVNEWYRKYFFEHIQQ